MNKERYNRHILLKEIGEKGQQKLLEASVLLIGAGGLGSPIALYLVAAGIGHLGIVDGDVVSESNLQRQVLYTSDEVGKPKVECAKQRLSALSKDTCIDAHPFFLDGDNAEGLISQYDIIVDGCDNFTTRYLINDTCVKCGKTYVYGSIGEFHGQVSVFNYRGGMNYRDLFPEEKQLTSQPRITSGVLGVVPGIIGCTQAAETIKIITGCGDVLRNRIFSIDVLTMQTDILCLD